MAWSFVFKQPAGEGEEELEAALLLWFRRCLLREGDKGLGQVELTEILVATCLVIR